MELIDIVNEKNEIIKQNVDRKYVHKNNLLHRHVSAWIMNQKGQILMQKRSLTKENNPGKWAKTRRHPKTAEEPDEAIIREVYEEIGLKVDKKDLEFISVFRNPNKIYFVYNYIIYTNKKENEFKFLDNEVDMVKYFDIEELIEQKDNKDFTFSKWEPESFCNEMNFLKQKRQERIKLN